MPSEKDFLEFEENPYNTGSRGPEEIVRLFYANDVPILPVVSKRGMLLGVLIKEKVISELSDLERTGNQKIDDFVTKVMLKMSLDDLLPLAGNIKEFIVINLFGEVFGRWSRLDLFTACENSKGKKKDDEVRQQKDEQTLEWLVYLVLEHIPRALYALNDKGKTFFYNSLFEDLFTEHTDKKVDPAFIEKSFANTGKNEVFYRNKGKKDIYFFNKEMNFYYERIPLTSEGRNVGFLNFVDKSLNEPSGSKFPGIDFDTMSYNEILKSVERSILVDSILQNKNNLDKTGKKLKLGKKTLMKKIEALGIDVKNKS
ncbi:MAG: hypothetical protein JW864_01535 [Spirochaetes bacterium]|nr:hypothetical protein [Spirochaetota bacterium]